MVKTKKKKAAASRPSAKRLNEVIAIGDLHGDYEALIEVLSHAGLINGKHSWRGGRATLIQIGDFIDRGPESEKVTDYLDKLSAQAARAGGKVIRIAGNHELELLRENFSITTINILNIEKYSKHLMQSALNGALLAAYATQGFIFTHAGICGPLQQVLVKELGSKKVTNVNLANLINSIFVKAIKNDDFSHPIFNVGMLRGGKSAYGGIFWEDITSFMRLGNPYHLKQVFGHTPLEEIASTADKSIFAIDVGLFSGYGGRRAYLRIKNGEPTPVNIYY